MAPEEKNGMAGIVDGKVVVLNPREGGRPAVLSPPQKGVEIYVNETKVQETVELREEDQVEVRPLVSTETALMQVYVSPDGLSGLLAVFPQITHSFFLDDAAMTRHLRPRAIQKEVRENVCTLADAEAELKKNKVTFGLDFAALKETVDKAEGQFQVVARGEKIRPGKNGFVEFLIESKKEKICYDEKKEKVDYREKYRFPTVQKGERIALIHPAVAGLPGQSVSGDILPPAAVKDVVVRCGDGAALQDNGREIAALRDGLLVVKGSFIKVEDLLLHNKDVDLKSGNLRFNGNIQIYGNIREGMQVEAQGNLYVDGNGYEATVQAGEGIHFTGNLIQCQVDGGLHYTFLQGAALLLEEIWTGYSKFLKSVKQVFSILSERKQLIDERIITFTIDSMLEKNLPAIQGPASKMEQLLEGTKVQNQQTKHLSEMLVFLNQHCFSRKPRDLQALENAENKLKFLLTGLQETLEKVPLLNASYVQNSNLNHSGEIHITGVGCYQTTLQAGKGVQIQGVFRGGKIRARGDVHVGEFAQMINATGSSEKEKMIGIKVPAEAIICFGKVHGDTAIQVGRLIYRFDREYERVQVSFDCAKGMLKITNY
jgi:hypothetical protein